MVRTHWGKDRGSWTTSASTIIETEKEKRLEKHEKRSFEMELQIPTEDSQSKFAEGRVPDSHQAMLKSFSSTVKGKIIQVDYFLKVFIKYDAWNEFGDGHCATIPIEILQPPTQLVMQAPMMMPAGFSPVM